MVILSLMKHCSVIIRLGRHHLLICFLFPIVLFSLYFSDFIAGMLVDFWSGSFTYSWALNVPSIDIRPYAFY